MKRLTRTFVGMIAAIAVMLLGFAPPASADEPVVDLGGIQYAAAQFETDGSAAAKASLRAQSGAKVVLNVHVNPMPKSQVKRCWKVKPGTWIKNEVIDPATGRPAVINWQVPAGDNTFCTKKGAGKQVFKKSCGNRVWGVPGGPKSPPKSLPRIKVKVQIQDYLTFKGKLKVQTSQSGSASAYVVQYYEGKKVCEASASVRGTGYVSVEAYISVRARTFTAIRVSATNSAKVSANTQITASGSLKAAVKLVLEGEAKAMCNFTPPPPPPPPPPVDNPPTINCADIPHMYHPNGNTLWFCYASDPDESSINLSQVKFEGDEFVRTANPVVTEFADDGNNPCPAGVTCFRVQLWAQKVGTGHPTATVTVDGKSDVFHGQVAIFADEF